jgi:(p)ppGpp synthase/HD superfamily hydrolase
MDTTTMATLEKAIELAAKAHAGQLDKEKLPYILHPLRVMMAVEPGEAQIVAVLHDTLEDTSLTEDDLRREGFGESVIAAVKAVTHEKSESYADYVIRAARVETARQVKLADLADNSSLKRAILRPDQAEKDFARIKRYYLSYKFLTGQHTEEEYRRLMSD